MTRTGKDAADWGRAQISDPSQNWYRLCKMFVRMCFAVPSDGTPDAGQAWDRAKFKHRTDNPASIPAFVPVFWELPSVADHVALSLGGGMCLSNDIFRSGQIDVARIHTITTRWGAVLQGWTEDIDSVRVWTPKEPEAETPNITAYLEADNHEDRIAALSRVVKHADGKARVVADRLITLHERRVETGDRIAAARKELRKLEVDR